MLKFSCHLMGRLNQTYHFKEAGPATPPRCHPHGAPLWLKSGFMRGFQKWGGVLGFLLDRRSIVYLTKHTHTPTHTRTHGKTSFFYSWYCLNKRKCVLLYGRGLDMSNLQSYSLRIERGVRVGSLISHSDPRFRPFFIILVVHFITCPLKFFRLLINCVFLSNRGGVT